MAKKKRAMQWEVRELPENQWGIFLKQEFCKTDEPVCYAASRTKEGAQCRVDRMNKESLEAE